MVSSGEYLGIELERSRDAAVVYYLEGFSDFETWVDVPFSEEVIDPDADDSRERIRLLSGLETDKHQRYFLRLRIAMP